MDTTGHNIGTLLEGNPQTSSRKDASRRKFGSQCFVKELLGKDKICTIA